jgi:hypothetical protein
MFPPELEEDAFRSTNGEFGWTRAQIPLVVDVLCKHRLGVLGGELWWVRDGIPDWSGLIPQRSGPPGVYCWETKRWSGELWPDFVERSISDSLAAVQRWPGMVDLPPDLDGRVLYNLCWVTEAEHDSLRGNAT